MSDLPQLTIAQERLSHVRDALGARWWTHRTGGEGACVARLVEEFEELEAENARFRELADDAGFWDELAKYKKGGVATARQALVAAMEAPTAPTKDPTP